MNTKLHAVLVLFVLLIFLNAKAQERPFTQVAENTFPMLQGDLELIGNNIVSIDEVWDDGNTYAPEDNFNEFANNADLIMNYIDIDNDTSTISSSSADLTLPSACSSIRYAGLYWSGTYFWNAQIYWDIDEDGNVFYTYDDSSGNIAYVTPTGDFTTINTGVPLIFPNRAYGQSDDPVNQDDTTALALPNPRTLDDANDFRYIKFAPPGAAYIDITPTSPVPSTVLYDGFRGTATNTSNTSVTDVPYVGYANVTSILQDIEAAGGSVSGTYTVGNVKCFTGRTDGGGTAGGWALVITYEDPTQTRKFISSLNGYAKINAFEAPITYDYQGFNTTSNGPVNARFGIAALEGDQGFEGDALEVQGDLQTNFTTIFDPVNPADNFFNASVSRNGANVTTRVPASSNTLGFDLDLFQIYNPNNTVLANGETGATFRTSTDGDTFGTFLNTFAIEVIEPDIRIIKTVENRDGNEIEQGDGVLLGQELFYVLTVQNIGNDDAINTIIRDQLPINTDLIPGTIVTPLGVTVDDSDPRNLVFTVDDDIVEIGDAPFPIRFQVQVASSCEALRDACSEEVNNTAEAAYEGRLSGIVITDDTSVFDVDDCENEGATNFIIDLGTCVFNYETFLCNGEAVLTAGNGYDSYTWRNSGGGEIGNSQTIIVNEVGTYTVDEVSNDCRSNTETHQVVPLTTNDQNPIILLPAPNNPNSFAFCTIDGSITPEYYLCGDESRVLDLNGFVNASTIEWERLDPQSCTGATSVPGCANTDSSCDWVTVGTGPIFTVNEAGQSFEAEGEYRFSVVFANTCTEFFYFNVYQSTLNPSLTKRDIICGEPGFVRVEDVPATGFEFSLDNTTFQESNEFTGISSPGEVTVYIRQTTGPVRCTFEERITLFEINTNVVITTIDPVCPEGNGVLSTGSIQIQLSSSQGTNSYTVSSGDFTRTQISDESQVTFDSLPAGTLYEVEVTSFDGICKYNDFTIINNPPPFSANSLLNSDLQCDVPAEITIELNQVATNRSLAFSIDNFATTLSLGDIMNPQNNPDPYYLNNADGTFSIFVNTPSTYEISILDNNSGCIITTNPVDVSDTCTLSNNSLNSTLNSTIYPNPTTGLVTISKTIDDITVLDMNGRVVYKTTGASFDIGHLKSGVYFVKLEKESQKDIQRIIKK